MDSHVPSNPKEESWTEEKHVSFLNSMKAWFVRTMLENNDRFSLRLDRHLPNTSDSTLDCKPNVPTANNHTAPGFIGTNRCKLKVKPDKRSRRSPHQPHGSSQDHIRLSHILKTEEKTEKRNRFSPIFLLLLHPN